MKITVENDPFPHIIIDNYYTEEECQDIWREIDFLYPKLGTPEKFYAAQEEDGTYITNSFGLSLDYVYSDRSMSDILRLSNKIFSPDFCNKFVSKNEYWNTILYSNKDYTKLRFYNEQSKYDSHRDIWVNAVVSTTMSVEEYFGGDLYFPCHNFVIKTENNKTVVFPGWVEHGVSEIKRGCRFAITKFIHCAAVNVGDK